MGNPDQTLKKKVKKIVKSTLFETYKPVVRKWSDCRGVATLTQNARAYTLFEQANVDFPF